MASEVNVDLIIKTPNLDVGDQQYKCDVNWTVKKLKSYLSNVYPTKPTVENQRLIYFGQVLSDNLILKDVFINKWKIQTIHMMCPPKKIPFKETSVSKTSTCKTSTETESTNSNHSNVIFQNMQEQLRNTSTNMSYVQGYPVNMIYDNNQIAMMQQAYTQYMMQYFQYMHSNTFSVDNNSSQVELSSSSPSPQPVEANISEVQHEENIGEDAPNVIVNEINEDPLANRDIIDVTYILIRVAVLLSVLYFYSSFSRCLFIIGISFFIYIYRGGFFTFRRERNRNDRRQVQIRRNTIRNRRNRARIINEANHNQQGAQNSQATVVKTFIASFFTSLIPEQLNAVNIN